LIGAVFPPDRKRLTWRSSSEQIHVTQSLEFDRAYVAFVQMATIPTKGRAIGAQGAASRPVVLDQQTMLKTGGRHSQG
jgi:hypothetical protein